MAEERTIRYRVDAATQGFQQGMHRSAASAQQASSRITRSMHQNRQALNAAGKASIGFGLALGEGLRRSISAGSDFQAEMNQVRAVSQATGSEFAQLSGIAREMGATTKFGATEAAEGLSFLSMAGFEAVESVKALPGVLDLAAAGNMELGRSADLSSNVLQGFSLEAEEMNRVVDTMAATFTSSNTSLEQMGQAMGFVAPVANAAGMSLEETAAAVGLMGDAGIQGTRAGTALRQSLSSLLSPTGSAEEAIARLGLQTTDTHGRLLPLHDIIGQLEEQGATAADVMDLFGQRAGPGMQTLLDRGSDALQEFAGDLEDSGGTAERVAETQMEGLRGSLTELGSAVEGLQIKIAESGGLLDSMESLTDTTTSLVQAMEGAPDEFVSLATQLAGSTAVVTTFGGAALLAASRLGGMRAALGGLVRFGGYGVLFRGLTKALGEVHDSAESANDQLDEIIETSNSVAEAERRAEQATRDMTAEFFNSFNVTEQWRTIWEEGKFGGIVNMIGDMTEVLKTASHETEIAAGFADRAAAGFSAWADEVDPLNLTLGGLSASIEETASATEQAGDTAGRTATGFAVFGDSIEDLSGIARDAFEAVAGGTSVIATYPELEAAA